MTPNDREATWVTVPPIAAALAPYSSRASWSQDQPTSGSIGSAATSRSTSAST